MAYLPVGYDVSNLLLRQRIDCCSLNNVSILLNNTAYSIHSIRRTDLQQIHTAYSNQLNTAYRPSDTVAELNLEVIMFYNGLDVPTRQILDSKGAIPTKTTADAKVAIQEMAEYSQKWHNGTSLKARSTKTSDGLAAIQAQLNSLGMEIKKVNKKVYAAQVRCELFKGPHVRNTKVSVTSINIIRWARNIDFGTLIR
ncbi:hypothetical protein Tco_0999881 [Tanacetum coccineum]